MLDNTTIGIIGLGYVGLPLAIEFGKKYNVIGFDINRKRVEDLNNGLDHTQEANISTLKSILKKDCNNIKNGLFFLTIQVILKNVMSLS